MQFSSTGCSVALIMPLHCHVMVPLPTTLKGKGKQTFLNVAQI